jgi:hypothetical protein
MKTKYALIIFFIGILINLFGALLKITHFAVGPLTGNLVLSIGFIIETLGIILLVYKLFTSSKFKEFLNG